MTIYGAIKHVIDWLKDLSVKQRVALMKKVAIAVVTDPKYQRGAQHWSDGSPKTFCNIAFWDAACRVEWWKQDDKIFDRYIGTQNDVFNYDLSPMFKDGDSKNILMTTIPYAYMQCQIAADKGVIRELTPKQAQERANQGVLVMGIAPKPQSGHVVGVWPTNMPFDPILGPKIFQAGWYNIYDVYISDSRCWGPEWTRYFVRFYEFRNRDTGRFV